MTFTAIKDCKRKAEQQGNHERMIALFPDKKNDDWTWRLNKSY